MNKVTKRVQVTVDEALLAKAKQLMDIETDEEAVECAVARVVSHAALDALRAHGPLQFFEDDEADLATATDEGRS